MHEPLSLKTSPLLAALPQHPLISPSSRRPAPFFHSSSSLLAGNPPRHRQPSLSRPHPFLLQAQPLSSHRHSSSLPQPLPCLFFLLLLYLTVAAFLSPPLFAEFFAVPSSLIAATLHVGSQSSAYCSQQRQPRLSPLHASRSPSTLASAFTSLCPPSSCSRPSSLYCFTLHASRCPHCQAPLSPRPAQFFVTNLTPSCPSPL